MDYEKFLQGIAWTKSVWKQRKHADEPECHNYTCFSYSALRKRGDDYWFHLERMDRTDLEEEVVDCFLNTKRWYCHLDPPGTPERERMLCNLKKAVDKLPAYYASVHSLRIEDVDFEGSVVLKGEGKPVTFAIDSIYSIFRQVKHRFAAVAASKLMHMAFPNLFILWDDSIINRDYGYHVPKQKLEGFGKRAWSYIAFLILMQENIHHIKEISPWGSSVTNQELFRRINGQVGEKDLPITRLLDMANYAVAHPEKGAPTIKCHRCMQITNRKLDELEWSRENKVGRYKC